MPTSKSLVQKQRFRKIEGTFNFCVFVYIFMFHSLARRPPRPRTPRTHTASEWRLSLELTRQVHIRNSWLAGKSNAKPNHDGVESVDVPLCVGKSKIPPYSRRWRYGGDCWLGCEYMLCSASYLNGWPGDTKVHHATEGDGGPCTFPL